MSSGQSSVLIFGFTFLQEQHMIADRLGTRAISQAGRELMIAAGTINMPFLEHGMRHWGLLSLILSYPSWVYMERSFTSLLFAERILGM